MSNVPLYPGYVVGWKGWTHISPPGLLTSASNQIWLPGEPAQAMCARGHEAPQYDCQCGFYATKEPDEHWATYSAAYGKVALWGRIVEHERGYRAQYAYPLELWVYPGYHIKLRDYGVPAYEERPPWYVPPQPMGPDNIDELRAKVEEARRRERERRQRQRQRLRELRDLAYEAGYVKPPRRWKGQLCLDFMYEEGLWTNKMTSSKQ